MKRTIGLCAGAMLLWSLMASNVGAAQYAPGPGNTLLLIGQTYQAEFDDYVNGIGITPSGSSHYSTIYSGRIEQGDDRDNNRFLSYIHGLYPGAHALVALSIKDNTWAANCGAPDAGGTLCGMQKILNGDYDGQIDAIAQILKQHNQLKFMVRIGYEVNEYLFQDPTTYINTYNYIAKRLRETNGVSNADFVYHPIRWFNDAKNLYPGGEYVDWIALSMFNHDVCLPVNGSGNCEGQRVDGNIALVFDWAQSLGKPLMIAEAAAQAPANGSSAGFIDYLSRLDEVIERLDVQALVYINSDWPKYGWPAEIWGDSRVENNSAVTRYWLDNFANNPRFLNYDDDGQGGTTPPQEPDCDTNPSHPDCQGPIDPPDDGKAFGLESDGTLYHVQTEHSASWVYLCLDSDCRSAELINGRWQRATGKTSGSYSIEFKVQDNASGQCIATASNISPGQGLPSSECTAN